MTVRAVLRSTDPFTFLPERAIPKGVPIGTVRARTYPLQLPVPATARRVVITTRRIEARASIPSVAHRSLFPVVTPERQVIHAELSTVTVRAVPDKAPLATFRSVYRGAFVAESTRPGRVLERTIRPAHTKRVGLPVRARLARMIHFTLEEVGALALVEEGTHLFTHTRLCNPKKGGDQIKNSFLIWSGA